MYGKNNPNCFVLVLASNNSTTGLPQICAAAEIHHQQAVRSNLHIHPGLQCLFHVLYKYDDQGWLGSRVVSMMDSGTEGPRCKLLPQRCRVTVLGKLFTPTEPLYQAAKLVAALLRVAGVTAGLAESNGSLVYDSHHLQADCQES